MHAKRQPEKRGNNQIDKPPRKPNNAQRFAKAADNQQGQRVDHRDQPIYTRSIIVRNFSLPMTVIGKDVAETLLFHAKHLYEGRCIIEGYVRKDSIQMINHSNGMIERGNQVRFEVMFECDVCFPVEGMNISCLVKNVVKAGIRAVSATETPSPFTLVIAKDHHYQKDVFSSINVGDVITARVIGQRFELNDTEVSIIAELVVPRRTGPTRPIQLAPRHGGSAEISNEHNKEEVDSESNMEDEIITDKDEIITDKDENSSHSDEGHKEETSEQETNEIEDDNQ